MDYKKPDEMSLNESAEVGLQIANIKDYVSSGDQPTKEESKATDRNAIELMPQPEQVESH